MGYLAIWFVVNGCITTMKLDHAFCVIQWSFTITCMCIRILYSL